MIMMKRYKKKIINIYNNSKRERPVQKIKRTKKTIYRPETKRKTK